MTGEVGAIVLAGGRSSRLDGTDKARIPVAGRPMLESVLGAAAAVADRVVTVGPGSDVREDPPFSGPLSGIAAGLAGLPVSVDLVVVVACDLPDLDAATLRALVAALRGSAGGGRAALTVDAAGHDQYLLAAWDRRALAARLDALERSGGLVGRPVRALYDDEEVLRLPVGDPARDVDTWADLAARGPIAFAHVAAVLAAGVTPLPPSARAPLDAVGAVLAEPLMAVDPMPREPVSAMDGYALAGPGPWRLSGPARRAGDASPGGLIPGTASAIATGALAPAGTDRVLRHELVEVGGAGVDGAAGADALLVTALPAAAGVDDLRPAGEDWPAGHELAPAGATLDAALASTALSAGLAGVAVRGPARAVVVTTGDEVVPFDTPAPLPPGRIRDTVGPLLGVVLARAGFAPTPGVPGHCPDSPGEMDSLLSGGPGSPGDVAGTEAGPADVLVLVGATGRGVADHLRPALQRVGARVVLDGVRVRPGGSQIVAVLPDGRILLGLPGNPLAAVCAAATTGRALVDALTGRSRTPERDLISGPVGGLGAYVSAGRARLLPARPDGAGRWMLPGRVRTAHLADLVGAPALALIPEAAPADDRVELIRWI